MVLQTYLKDEKNKLKIIIIAIVTAIFLPIVLLMVAAPSATYAVHEEQGLEEHCPDHEGHPGKVQASGDPAAADQTIVVDGQDVQVVIEGKTVEFFDENGDPIVVEFCIKAADLAGGKETGSSGTVDWVNHGGQIPDISYVVVYKVVEEEPTGSLVVNKVLLNASGAVTGGNTEANTLGFRWGFQGESISSMMGTTVTELEPKSYEVTENTVTGYSFAGYYLGEGSCAQTEADKTLPVSVEVEADTTTEVTFCNQAGGEVLGDTTTTTPQVLAATTQVAAPVGGVGAGGEGTILGSIVGLGSSLTALSYGVVNLLKKES
jgi:hypothetical protein